MLSVEELVNWQNQTKIDNLISLDEYLEQGSEAKVEGTTSSHFEQPEKVVEREELKTLLAETLESLTENERKVILFYYYEELTLKEISKILEVSESRISQLHTKALLKMRRKTIQNNLNAYLPSKNDVLEILNELNINPLTRPESLSLDDFIRISNKIYDKYLD